MTQKTIKKSRKRWLSVVGIAVLILLGMMPYGTIGLALLLGLIVDISTIITVLVARYARKNSHVVIGAVTAALACEVLATMFSPTNRFGTMLILRLAGQGVVAIIVRTWLKKARPVIHEQEMQ